MRRIQSSRAANRLHTHGVRAGFLLLDVLLGISVFAIFVGASGFSLLFSQEITIKSGDRIRAIFLSEQAIDAVRSIRDTDFSQVTAGEHGVQIDTNGKWQFSGTGVLSEDGFLTTLTIALPDAHRATVYAETTWDFGQRRFGSASLVTEVTDWRRIWQIGNWANASVQGTATISDTPLFQAVTVAGNTAFVTSSISSGGAGLYVFDVTDLSSPTHIASSFALGVDGYQILADENILYVVTGDSSSEIRAYDISDPSTLSDSNLLGSYNVPGSGRARSIAKFGDTLFVGATEDGSEAEFYALDASVATSIALLDSLQDEGTYLDISLSNGYAYIANSEDVSELTIIDIFDPADLLFASGVGYNLTDVPDGLAVATTGTGVLVGRSVGDITEEFILFDTAASPVPSPPPGPWYHNMGNTTANVHAIDAEPTGKYAFVGSDVSDQQLQVMNLPIFMSGGLPRVQSIATSSGPVRSLVYSVANDRVFLVTNSQLLILRPS